MPRHSLKGALGLVAQLALHAEAAQTVWSSFAYVFHGELTPILSGDHWPTLTTLGAQQLYSQGQMFKARYLGNETLNGSNGTIITPNIPLVGLSRDAIENTQLSLYSTSADYDVASALAFMQGLYPPADRAFTEESGGAATATLANGTLVDYPLNGYQYPSVQAKGIYDGELFQIQGDMYCSELVRSRVLAGKDDTFSDLFEQGPRLYDELKASVLGNQTSFPSSSAEFSPLDLWNYATFEYNHNATVRAQLSRDLLNELGALASVQQFDFNGNLTASGRHEGDMIRAIAGRTLAARVYAELRQFTTGARGNKLSLVVGSFEPMLAFFSLARLAAGPAAPTFQKMPSPGAAMVFELFSTDESTTTTTTTEPPAEDDLWVRFLYRDGTEPDDGLYEYPILGFGNSETAIPWGDFAAGINDFAISDLRDWCETCNAVTPPCMAYAEALGGGGGSGNPNGFRDRLGERGLSRAGAGAVGALIMLSVLGAAAAAAMFLGGLRVRRKGHEGDAARRRGGFKGAEKKVSDRDLSFAAGGARQERIGSWEMGSGKPVVSTASMMPAASGPPPAYPPAAADDGAPSKSGKTTFGATVVRKIDDDGVSILSEEPVKPRETV